LWLMFWDEWGYDAQLCEDENREKIVSWGQACEFEKSRNGENRGCGNVGCCRGKTWDVSGTSECWITWSRDH
jgi:hypothetical protein